MESAPRSGATGTSAPIRTARTAPERALVRLSREQVDQNAANLDRDARLHRHDPACVVFERLVAHEKDDVLRRTGVAVRADRKTAHQRVPDAEARQLVRGAPARPRPSAWRRGRWPPRRPPPRTGSHPHFASHGPARSKGEGSPAWSVRAWENPYLRETPMSSVGARSCTRSPRMLRLPHQAAMRRPRGCRVRRSQLMDAGAIPVTPEREHLLAQLAEYRAAHGIPTRRRRSSRGTR
jgi:hypothetical protein